MTQLASMTDTNLDSMYVNWGLGYEIYHRKYQNLFSLFLLLWMQMDFVKTVVKYSRHFCSQFIIYDFVALVAVFTKILLKMYNSLRVSSKQSASLWNTFRSSLVYFQNKRKCYQIWRRDSLKYLLKVAFL